MGPATARIVSLRVHPVKGCRALEVREAGVTSTGLEWDRNWMFVADNGRFLTQREVPGLARIDASVLDGHLVLRAQGVPDLRVPVDSDRDPVKVTIWRDSCVARPAAADTREWLQRVTGTSGQLVKGMPRHERVSSAEFTGADRGEVFFADAYALLVTSAASLEALNARLDEPLPMNRFRPNIVVEGLEAFAEDRVEWLRTGPVALKLVKPCTRCVVTTTDQATGERRGEEPLSTLRTFRWLPQLKGVAFGMNGIVVGGAGERLAVGDQLDVTWQRQVVAAPA